MPGGSLGRSYVEVDMDFEPYNRSTKKLLKEAQTASTNIEENFKRLGIKSSTEFDLMRQKATKAYDMIANSSKATADDIIRAERAKNEQLTRINDQQFGHQAGLIETIKNHWIAAAAAIAAAWKFERMVEGWIKLADVQRIAENSLKQAMISNDRFSESAYQGMLKTASAMQEITGIGDELIMSAQTILQRFDKIPNELLPRVTRAILDMGAATGNYTNVARDLGRASEGMTDNLRRQGIFLDEVTIKEKGFVGVLEEVEKKFGGQAEVLAEGTGQWKVLSAGMGDAKEKAGDLFQKFAEGSGIIDGLTFAVTNLNTALEKLNDLDAKKTGLSPSERAFDIVARNVEDKRLSQLMSDYIMNLRSSPSEIAQLMMYQEMTSDNLLSNLMTIPPKITEEQTDALKEVRDIIDDLTLSERELAIKKLNDQFAEFKGILGDIPEVTRAFELSLDAINKKFEESPGISGYETYMDYSRVIQQGSLELQNQNKILGEINPSIDLLVAGYNDFLDEIDESKTKAMELQKIFTSISDGITDSFRDAFRDIIVEGKLDFEKLGDSIRGVFADVAADIAKQKFIQPAMQGVMANITGMSQGNVYPSNFVGPLPQGATYAGMGSTLMGGLGSGAMAYGMTGSSLSGLGAGAGFMLGGPMGALFGGVGGLALESIFDTSKPISFEAMIEEKSLADIRNTFGDALGQGFLDAYHSRSFDEFKNGISEAMGSSIDSVLQTVFISMAMKPLEDLFAPMFKKANLYAAQQTAIEALGPDWEKSLAWTKFAPLVKGQEEGMIQLSDIISAAPDSEQIAKYFESLQPVFEQLIQMGQDLAEKMGVNTNAVIDNTEAILGPIESLLRDLQVGDLAPAQSIEGYVAEYQKLFEGIGLGTVDTSTFAGFAREYLDFSKTYGGYGGTAGKVTGDLQTLLNLYQTPAMVSGAAQVKNRVPDQIYPNERYSNSSQIQASRMTVDGILRIDKSGLGSLMATAIRTDPEVRDAIRGIK